MSDKLNDQQKAALRQVLDAKIAETIASYHGFMEGTVHSKAAELLNETWRSALIDEQVAASDAWVGPQPGDDTANNA
jgi:hypothetical protein